MKTRLTYHDIERLKIQAGYGEGPVVIPREDFEELIDNYLPYHATPAEVRMDRREIRRF